MCGARKVLIAYNINIIGTKEQANKIAFDIREQGRGQNEPGCFKAVQAMVSFHLNFIEFGYLHNAKLLIDFDRNNVLMSNSRV